MNNPNDVTRLKHLDSLAADVAIRVPTPTAADHDKFLRGDGTWALPTVEGGGSGGSSGQIVLGTTPSTVNGAMWYEFEDGVPVIKMHYGDGFELSANLTFVSTYNGPPLDGGRVPEEEYEP